VQLALLSCWAPVKSLAVTCVLADELPSVKALLGDLKGDVDILDLPEMESIEQIA